MRRMKKRALFFVKLFLFTPILGIMVWGMLTDSVCAASKEEKAADYDLDSHGDDPVAGDLEKDDFETKEEWEDYQKKHSNLSIGVSDSLKPQKKLKMKMTLRYTIYGLPLPRVIQKCYIDEKEKYMYITQRKKCDTYLSKCVIDKEAKKVTRQSTMILKNFGHGQTLEYFEHNGKAYFWITAKANTAYEMKWGMQIARIQYKPGKVIKNYTGTVRFTDLNYANTDGEAFGKVKRADAALSDDGNTLLIWVRTTKNKLLFSTYDANVLNQLLDEKEGKEKCYISFKNNKTLQKACLGSYEQHSTDKWTLPNESFQGAELTDSGTIYVVGGMPNDIPGLIVLTGKGDTYRYSALITFENSEFKKMDQEIEGIQLKGDRAYIGICDHKQQDKKQFLYSIDRSVLEQFEDDHEHEMDQGKIVISPTAIEKGVKTYTCKICGATRSVSVAAKGIPKKGKKLVAGSVTYKVTKAGAKNGTVEYVKKQKKTSSVTIPATVKIDGITYQVTSIGEKAFYNNKKLTKVTIEKNVSKIGKSAFNGCSKLNKIWIKSAKLKAAFVGTKSFYGIGKNSTIQVPKSKKKFYKQILKKTGVTSSVSIK